MEEYIGILKNTKIFSGVNEDELKAMLGCLGAKAQRYGKGEYVLFRGEELERIPILVEGKLHIQNEDYWGNRSILGSISVGEMFGEAYAVPESGPVLNDVVAVEESTVIFFDVKKLMTTCPSGCRFHSLVIRNLFYEISERNRKLVQKLGHMSKRSTREKLISYLSEEAKRQKNAAFEIPFNRQQLADFLSVDRSAMSAELCKMRDEGMIKFQKNRFELL
ncbi:MAG: Crp/Fnr family transcriptional regulator [Clostridia bacterium]|nr:Crp/Fnr family transcriptional regulator [Clostridia bacterium]